jgi:ketosteroid isomerase-like protein
MRVLTSVALLACIGAPIAYAQQVDDPDAESKIIAMERIAKLQACDNKDPKTLRTILDDAFVAVNQEGRVLTKTELLMCVQAIKSFQFTMDQMVVKLHGDTAIVTGLYRMRGVERGKPFLRRGRFVDTWLHKRGRWVAIASLSTPMAH